MSFSRMHTYKEKRKKVKAKFQKIAISATVIIASFLSTSIVFADIKVSEYLKNWYAQKVAQVEESLISSLESEATLQKAKLLKEVREKTEQSIEELRKHAAILQDEIANNLDEKAKEAFEAAENRIDNNLEAAKEKVAEEILKSEVDRKDDTTLDETENDGSIEEVENPDSSDGEENNNKEIYSDDVD